MASKRRASRAPEQKKRKHSIADQSDLNISEALYEFLQSTLSLVQELRDGSRLTKTQFMKLPSKKLYPDYYEKISDPISLHEIKAKVDNKKYSDANEFLNDFKLMSENASAYNMSDSLIAIDAQNIYNFVNDQVKQYLVNKTSALLPKEGEPKKLKLKLKQNKSVSNQEEQPAIGGKEQEEATQSKEDEKQANKTGFYQQPINAEIKGKLLQLVDEIINYEHNEEMIADVFLEEPSKKLYPDYYQIIQKPTSLTTIQKNLNNRKTHKYFTVQDFVNEVNLIWSNAQTYNEEGSPIYDYSVALSRAFNSKIEKIAGAPLPQTTSSQSVSSTAAFDEDNIASKQEEAVEKDVPTLRRKSKTAQTSSSTHNDGLKLKLSISKSAEDTQAKKRGRPTKGKEASERSSSSKSRRARSVNARDADAVVAAADTTGTSANHADDAADGNATDAEEQQEQQAKENDLEAANKTDDENDADKVKSENQEAQESLNGILDESGHGHGIVNENGESNIINLEKELTAKFKPSRKIKDGKNALIKNITIFSSRPKFNSAAQRLAYAQNNADAQFAQTVFQNWFEYNFEANDYKITNYSLNLPIFNNNSASKGAITILATLNDDLVEKKYINLLSVNDEKVKPSPSITYADSDRILTSRYDLKLALGLNNVRLSVKVLKDSTLDFKGGIDSGNIITGENVEVLPEENIDFWINVCQ